MYKIACNAHPPLLLALRLISEIPLLPLLSIPLIHSLPSKVWIMICRRQDDGSPPCLSKGLQRFLLRFCPNRGSDGHEEAARKRQKLTPA